MFKAEFSAITTRSKRLTTEKLKNKRGKVHEL